MRVFKIWRVAETMVVIDGDEESISCMGGSNDSEEDAISDGLRRLEAVKRRIAGAQTRRDADYEGDILEEPIEWIGEHDVITRTRYGAEVLNSTSCIFVDIDEPVFRIWEIFRRTGTREQKKQAILKFVERRLKKPDLRKYGIRVYETHSGVRVILEGKALDPQSREAKKLLRSFNADRLYSYLCRKQRCYRARLTPKPYRIKMKAIRLRYPYEEEEQDRIDTWVGEYTSMSQKYSTCRLVRVLGSVSVSPAVRYHDEKTRAQSGLPLA